jgi:glyoxylase-like metal-dependent hydrolase (beta-lactamase superfamily II)
MTAQVSVLFDGYSRIDETKNIMRANCSCTLIQSKGVNVIVDTLTAWDRTKLIEALKTKHNLNPDDIRYVVCTHGHSDHVGNNNLFLNAIHIVGKSVSVEDEYDLSAFDREAVYTINEEMEVFPTPGHTLDSVSVKVKSTRGIIVIAGDLFEKQEDLENEDLWKSAGSEDPVKQEANRQNVLKIADFIVPGHGPMFPVPE